MASIQDAPAWNPIYQLETSDDVLGGPGGVANYQAVALAARTVLLKQGMDTNMNEIQAARGGLPALAARLVAMDQAIGGKAANGHGHLVSDVTGLQGALDSKAPNGHGHQVSDVAGLQGALDSKAANGHGHQVSDVAGLQGALDSKAANGHGHQISDVAGLQGAITALQNQLSTIPPMCFELTVNSTNPSATKAQVKVVCPSVPDNIEFFVYNSAGELLYVQSTANPVDSHPPSYGVYQTTFNLGGRSGIHTMTARGAKGVAVGNYVGADFTIGSTGGGGGGGWGCVLAGALVPLADGRDVEIERLSQGILTRGYCDKTWGPVVATITAVYRVASQPIWRVVTHEGEREWSASHQLGMGDRFVQAQHLKPGDVIRWEIMGVLDEAQVISAEFTGRFEDVYHLSMSHGHVWVADGVPAHNKAPLPEQP